MNTVANEAKEYLYVIHGVIPEVMPSVAYRRTGRPELAERKIIRCPYCGGPLTDVERHTLVQIYRTPKRTPRKPIPGQFFKVCGLCSREVGIVMK